MSTSSNKYQQLWSNLTTYAIEPSMRTLTEKSSRNHARGGSRRRRPAAHAKRTTPKKTFGNDDFISTWTTPLATSAVQPRRSVRKKSKRGRKKGNKQYTRQSGGFVRDGSVQHWPCSAADDAILGEDVALIN